MVLLLLLYYIGQEDHMGIVTVKTVPVLREDDAVIFPPCASTILLERERPRPVPVSFRE